MYSFYSYHLWRPRDIYFGPPNSDEAVSESYYRLDPSERSQAVPNVSQTNEDIENDPWWAEEHNGITSDDLVTHGFVTASVVENPQIDRTIVKAVPVKPNYVRGIKYKPKTEKLFRKGTFADLLRKTTIR